jgi:hypothetical protein
LLIMKLVDIWSRDVDFCFRSLAASAPIWQFTDLVDCGAFLQTVTKTFRHHSPPCADNIFQSWGVINNTGSTGNSGLNGFPYQVLDCFTMILHKCKYHMHTQLIFIWSFF